MKNSIKTLIAVASIAFATATFAPLASAQTVTQTVTVPAVTTPAVTPDQSMANDASMKHPTCSNGRMDNKCKMMMKHRHHMKKHRKHMKHHMMKKY